MNSNSRKMSSKDRIETPPFSDDFNDKLSTLSKKFSSMKIKEKFDALWWERPPRQCEELSGKSSGTSSNDDGPESDSEIKINSLNNNNEFLENKEDSLESSKSVIKRDSLNNNHEFSENKEDSLEKSKSEIKRDSLKNNHEFSENKEDSLESSKSEIKRDSLKNNHEFSENKEDSLEKSKSEIKRDSLSNNHEFSENKEYYLESSKSEIKRDSLNNNHGFSENKEDSLESLGSKNSWSYLTNHEKKETDHSVEDIISGLEKTSLIDRGGPDKPEKSYARLRPKPPRAFLEVPEESLLNHTYTTPIHMSMMFNMEHWQSRRVEQGSNLRTPLQSTYQEDYTNFSNLLPLNSLGSSVEPPVNIDEITPTLPLQNFSPGSNSSCHTFTESLELFSEIPQDAWHSVLATSNETLSSLSQTSFYSRSSSTLTESQYTEPSLKFLEDENFTDFLGGTEGYSSVSSFPESEGLVNYSLASDNEAIVPSEFSKSYSKRTDGSDRPKTLQFRQEKEEQRTGSRQRYQNLDTVTERTHNDTNDAKQTVGNNAEVSGEGNEDIKCEQGTSAHPIELWNIVQNHERFKKEYDGFEIEIKRKKLGTCSKNIIHYMTKKRDTNYRGTNLHDALKKLNIVRFYIIIEKYQEIHSDSRWGLLAIDSDGKTVYDIAKRLMEEKIEHMDLVVKYLKEKHAAVEGIAKRKRERKKNT